MSEGKHETITLAKTLRTEQQLGRRRKTNNNARTGTKTLQQLRNKSNNKKNNKNNDPQNKKRPNRTTWTKLPPKQTRDVWTDEEQYNTRKKHAPKMGFKFKQDRKKDGQRKTQIARTTSYCLQPTKALTLEPKTTSDFQHKRHNKQQKEEMSGSESDLSSFPQSFYLGLLGVLPLLPSAFIYSYDLLFLSLLIYFDSLFLVIFGHFYTFRISMFFVFFWLFLLNFPLFLCPFHHILLQEDPPKKDTSPPFCTFSTKRAGPRNHALWKNVVWGRDFYQTYARTRVERRFFSFLEKKSTAFWGS